MNSGLAEAAVAQIRAVFSKHPEVEKVILYGSRAKGNYKPGSDIDLTLLGHAMTHKILGQIQSELEEGLLPHRFDLSIFSQITQADLIEHIRRVGVVFYERKPAAGVTNMETTIYVYLLDEGTDVWRPVVAERVGDERYRITGSPPDDTEKWQFKTGETVHCREKIFSSGERGLVAYERVTA